MKGKNIIVLIVDDEKRLLKSLAAFFEDEGFEVNTAENGEEALELLHERPVDIAIIDLRLSGINGYELILQAYEIQPDIKFLIHTGSTNFTIPDNIRNLDISEKDVYLKPVRDMNVMTEHIRRLISG